MGSWARSTPAPAAPGRAGRGRRADVAAKPRGEAKKPQIELFPAAFAHVGAHLTELPYSAQRDAREAERGGQIEEEDDLGAREA